MVPVLTNSDLPSEPSFLNALFWTFGWLYGPQEKIRQKMRQAESFWGIGGIQCFRAQNCEMKVGQGLSILWQQ
jgi:hypothetical protein